MDAPKSNGASLIAFGDSKLYCAFCRGVIGDPKDILPCRCRESVSQDAEPMVGPRILTLGQQRALIAERDRLRTWVAGVVLMVETNALDPDGKEGIRRTGKEILGA